MNDNFHLNNISTVPITRPDFILDTKSKTFFMGSCFASNIFNVFDNLYLNSLNSPFGNIYNPKSLGNSLNRILNKKYINKDECFKVDGLYQHFDFYSKLGKSNIDDYIQSINNSIEITNSWLLEANLIIITLGTAFVFEKSGDVVNNCHRLPGDTFNRRELELDEISNSILEPLKKLKNLNSNINIVLTLSPVRHLRDSPQENSYSKALLRVGIDKILKSINCYYFPSYEILLDELRDYRWYKNDLAHPNDLAVEYICNSFIDSCKSAELTSYIKRIQKTNSMLNHKTVNSESESSKKFLLKRENMIKQLKKDFYYMNKVQEIRSSPHL